MTYYLSMLMARIGEFFKSMPVDRRGDRECFCPDLRSESEKSGAGVPSAENNWGASAANIPINGLSGPGNNYGFDICKSGF